MYRTNGRSVLHQVSAVPSLVDAAAAIRRLELTPSELLAICRENIAGHEGRIGALAHLDASCEQLASTMTEEARANRFRGPLHGIPLLVKDVIDVAGMPTTSNSRVSATSPAEVDATVIARLRRSGALLIGKAVNHEFASAGPPRHLPYGAARNPWNTEFDTGGSSSGTAAAVSAGFCVAGVGTDTGGSIRNPISCCGGVGLKPSVGRVSRTGLVPLSWSFDTCGPMCWTVADCAALLQAMVAFDPFDPASVDRPELDFSEGLGTSVAGKRIGIPRRLVDHAGVDDRMRRMLDEASAVFASLGVRVDDIDLPDKEVFAACGRTIILSESYAFHFETLSATPELYGAWTRQRLMAGRHILAKDYIQALRVRQLLKDQVDSALRDYDAILSVAASAPPSVLQIDGADLHWSTVSPTLPFSVSGHPSLAMTGGFSNDGLPVGLQLIGRMFDEAALFQLASAYEATTAWLPRERRLPLRQGANASILSVDSTILADKR